MDDDVMTAVRIDVAEVHRHRELLLARLRVFLAQVPVQRELIAEPGNELSDVQLAFRTKVAAIERLCHWCRQWCRCRRATDTPGASFGRSLSTACGIVVRISPYVVIVFVF